MNWTEDDYMDPEQEREIEAREECARRGIDPDEICADGGVTAWMVVDKEMRDPLGASLEVARGYREMLETQRKRIEALEAALRLRDALIEAADDLYAAYAGFARTDGQHEAMSNFSTASNTYRAALAPEQDK